MVSSRCQIRLLHLQACGMLMMERHIKLSITSKIFQGQAIPLRTLITEPERQVKILKQLQKNMKALAIRHSARLQLQEMAAQ